MPELPTNQPLLTLAIPTYRRAAELSQLLTILQPQLRDHPEIDLYISNNASPDDTCDVIQRFQQAGMQIRSHRHPENIGSDANFVSCFHAALGTYFWLVGDDDIILPGTIAQLLDHLAPGTGPSNPYDIVYLTSYGFHSDHVSEATSDPLGRRFHNITDPLLLARVVNIMFTFISGIIVNRNRWLELSRMPALRIEDPSEFLSTNLTQLSWTLPLLRAHRRSLVLWNRPIAGRQGNGGGYSVGHVFGQSLVKTCSRLLPDRPALASTITNFAVRRWFPNALYEIRVAQNPNFTVVGAEAELRQAYGNNMRYWLFAWPVLVLPLPIARLWVKAGIVFSKVAYTFLIPKYWRKEI